MILSADDLAPRGEARTGWTVNLQSEYDCQNLLYSVVKPWLPGLSREEVAIWYDDQEKRSDFSLFGSKLIVEMKFIDTDGKKRQVVKTLEGLSKFYQKNANVAVLLFIVFVKGKVAVDAPKWQADFSRLAQLPRIHTIVIPVP